ncbi:MAG: hypothetical protein R6V03_11270 [Kiritimatiellia bacterium]
MRYRGIVYSVLIVSCFVAFHFLGVFARAENESFPADTAARIEQICSDVERIRGLKFKRKVGFEVQGMEEFREYAVESFKRQMKEGEAEAYVAGLVRIGALKNPVDLMSVLLSLAESQAAAHYDPYDEKYCLIMAGMPQLFLDVVSSHELCHALQDQHFDLEEFVYDDETLENNSDAESARQCVIEGEATLVMTIWAVMSQMSMQDTSTAETAASISIEMQKSMDLAGMFALSDSSMQSMDVDPEFMEEARKELEKLPVFFVETLIAAYIEGAAMIDYVKKKRKGWRGVSRLYSDPPVSTEQVLHPRKLMDPRDRPRDAEVEGLEKLLPEGWRVTEHNVLGELGIRTFLKVWAEEPAAESAAAASAAAGWGGDRYYLCEDAAGGDSLLVWKTVWDTRADASEFVTAYRILISRRFPHLRKSGRSEASGRWVYQAWEAGTGRYIKVMRDGTTVGIMDTTSRPLLDLLWSNTPARSLE